MEQLYNYLPREADNFRSGYFIFIYLIGLSQRTDQSEA